MNPIKLGLVILFHPTQGFKVLKEGRDNFKHLPALVLLLLVLLVRVIAIYGTHFPLSLTNPRQTNIINELVKTLLPILTWTIACYGITSIMDGKTLLKEQLLATTYAMLPYILLTVPYVILSHTMGGLDSSMFVKLEAIKWFSVVFLLFVSLKTMNEYKFWKTVRVGLLCIIACFLIWILLALFFILIQQVYDFFHSLLVEIKIFYLS